MSSPTTDLPILPVPPLVMNGDALYDVIMGGIEPALTTARLPETRRQILKNTLPERQAAAKKFAAAFAEYPKRLAAYQTEWDATYQRYKTKTMRILQEWSEKHEDARISSLEELFASSHNV